MKTTARFAVLIHLALTLPLETSAQSIPYGSVGSIGILMENTSVPATKKQGLTLLGCNTRIDTAVAPLWGRDTWQTISNIPFGPQSDAELPYFVSKYYLASPPIIAQTNKCGTLYDIGLVLPDQFNLSITNPKQKIIFNYDTLQPMKVHYLPVTYDQSQCQYKYVPINIECDDFPSISGKPVGGTGIGTLTVKDSSRLFLPYACDTLSGVSSKPLNCVVTILNDIIPDYKLSFDVDEKYCAASETSPCQSINLRKLFADGETNVKIICNTRTSEDIAEGCVE